MRSFVEAVGIPCPRCSRSASPQERFCRHCGTLLGVSQVAPRFSIQRFFFIVVGLGMLAVIPIIVPYLSIAACGIVVLALLLLALASHYGRNPSEGPQSP